MVFVVIMQMSDCGIHVNDGDEEVSKTGEYFYKDSGIVVSDDNGN